MRLVPLLIDILRHGDAAPPGPDGDASRPLSQAGVEQIRRLGAQLAARGWKPARAFASPLTRAQQTARLLLAPLAAAPGLETMAELHPESEPDEVRSALEALGATDGHVVLVSHMPLVSRLCAFLSGETPAFDTADLARLECRDGLTRHGATWGGFLSRPE